MCEYVDFIKELAEFIFKIHSYMHRGLVSVTHIVCLKD